MICSQNSITRDSNTRVRFKKRLLRCSWLKINWNRLLKCHNFRHHNSNSPIQSLNRMQLELQRQVLQLLIKAFKEYTVKMNCIQWLTTSFKTNWILERMAHKIYPYPQQMSLNNSNKGLRVKNIPPEERSIFHKDFMINQCWVLWISLRNRRKILWIIRKS